MSADGRAVALADGRRVEIRPAAPGDRDAVVEFLETLARTSLEARRIAAARAGTRRQREQLVANERERRALVAIPADSGRPIVGFAGWVHLPEEESCQLTLAVEEGWHDCGLGGALLEALVHDAHTEGYRRFHAEMHAGNQRMLALLRELISPLHTRLQAGVERADFEVPR